MNATSIILLVGLISFWGAIGLMVISMIRFKKTLEALEATLTRVQNDLAELSPALSETLQEVEKTGQEVGHTAAEVRYLAKRINGGPAPDALRGVVAYLPAAIGLFRVVKPLFSRGKK